MDTCEKHIRPMMKTKSGIAFCPMCEALEAEAYFERGEHPPTITPGYMTVPAAKSSRTTISLDAYDMARAKTLAEKKGMRYQTYIKSLLHQALDVEERMAQ